MYLSLSGLTNKMNFLKKRISLFVVLLFHVTAVYPQDSVSLKFFSPRIPFNKLDKSGSDKSIIYNKVFIYTPKEYKKNRVSYPLVYLLHGWAGSSYDWKNNYDIQKLADKYKMIIVLPDGYYDSWYGDNINKKELQYESAFFKRIVPFVETRYRIDPKNVFITGLSMGGHGAISFYLKHNKHFKAAGSMSGILDISLFKDKWGIKKKFGDYKKYKKYWEKNSSVQLLKTFKGAKSNLRMFVTCGDKDFAYKANSLFWSAAANLKIPMISVKDKGDHNWEYWTSHIDSQILFFSLVAQNNSIEQIKKKMKL
ncbi:hypothetical protein MASR2M39_21530 [Ignavibacteriales bacterium]